LDSSEGSRFAGEAGHFFDVLVHIINSRPVGVSASALRPRKATQDDLENVLVVVRYENGSLGNLLYLTQGGSKVPKEYLEIFGGGMTAQLNNFESVIFFDDKRRKRVGLMGVDKGQQAELAAFVDAARTGAAMPIPVENIFDTTLTTLAAMDSIRVGKEIALADYWVDILNTGSNEGGGVEQ
jgi:hypothetical protein